MHANLRLRQRLVFGALSVIGLGSIGSPGFAAAAYVPITPTMGDRTIMLTGMI